MEEKVKEIFEEIFDMEIDIEFNKFSTDKWDSFMHLDLLVSLEKELGVSFTPDEIGKIESFKDVVEVLNEKIK